MKERFSILLKLLFALHVSLILSVTTATAVPSDSLLHTEDQESPAGDSFAGVLTALPNDSIQKYIDLARTVIDEARRLQNFVENLNQATNATLPVILPVTLGGIEYHIVINAVRLKPAYAELDVFMQFEPPQADNALIFYGKGIKLTNSGSIAGDARLGLLGDQEINIGGNKIQLVLNGANSMGGTFASIDCDGFRELSIDADLRFSREILVPENPDGSVSPEILATHFSATLNNWNDLLISIELPPFQVATLPGFGFSASDVVFDFSDTRNTQAIVFPNGYGIANTTPGNENLWRGLYMRELTVRIPSEFRTMGNERTELRASHLLIDKDGVTGSFSGNNLIQLDKGNMSGWAFSLDSLAVGLVANQIRFAGFGGRMVVPLSSEETPFRYSATISADNKYLFNVAPGEGLHFDIWKAQVDIDEGSSLEIEIVDGRFSPRAILHGRMSINAGFEEESGGEGVELANIKFENLVVQAEKPYLKVGVFSFGSEGVVQKLAQFPINIGNIGLKNISETQTSLDVDILVNIVGEGGGAFAAASSVSLVGSLDISGQGRHRWRMSDIQVHAIELDVDGGAYRFAGSLNFYKNDAVYGNGFNGQVKAEFTPGIKVDCSALFGNVDGNRYWYADALATFDKGMPVFTGAAIYGFGGGSYFGVKIDNQGGTSELGRTASGIIYIPDPQAGLGLKAVVALGSYSRPDAFNGDATFEIAFLKGGGVRRIGLSGNGYFATPGLELNVDGLKATTNKMVGVMKSANAALSSATYGTLMGDDDTSDLDHIFGSLSSVGKKGEVSARLSIDYDFENRVLHGTCEAFVNVAGGIIKGVGTGGRAGWAVLHFAPGEWYVYIGTPDDRIGLGIGIGSIRANATGYMMVGTKIPGSPPPPDNVSSILGGMDLDTMRDLNALGTGAGFAFGAALGVDTGDLRFLMFYARFAAGAGFDIMLKDYGDTHCAGQSDRIGINGWYANGQAYAYLEGKIGIRVKVFGQRRNIKILEVGAAAILQAKLPNPVWLQGIVGGRFSVLGGLVRGSCRFKMTIGHECQLISEENLLEDVHAIASITPSDGSKEISVFNAPQGLFNIEIDKQFEIVDPQANTLRLFRARLDHFKVMDGSHEIPATLEWNETSDVVALNSLDILPPTSNLTTSLQLSFEEKVSGTWRPVVDEGKTITESKGTIFETGTAPDFIPESNILFNYPVSNQLNFYTHESGEGYVQLKVGQPYLFEADDQYDLVVRYHGFDGQLLTGELDYLPNERRVVFPIPDMNTNSRYQLEFVNVPKQDYKVDQNVSEVISASSVDSEIETRGKNAEGQLNILSEKIIFSTHFKTSQFTTFSEKINSLSVTNTFSILTIPWRIHRLVSFVSGPEYFDLAEISGVARSQNIPLVQIEANVESNAYYQEVIYPLVYDGYPIDGDIKISWRDVNELGLPPVKAMYIYQEPSDLVLSEEDITVGNSSISPSACAFAYDLPYYMANDFQEIQARVVSRYIHEDTISNRVRQILFSPFPVVSPGEFMYRLKYALPGINKITSEVEFKVSYK